MSREYRLHNGQRGVALAVRVTPRASRDEIAEVLHDGTIRVRLTAPAVESETNKALVRFLAGILAVSERDIEVVAGQNGRDKLVSIVNIDKETAHERILGHLT